MPLPLSQLVNPSTLTLDTDPLDTLLRDVLDPWDHRGSSRDPVLSIAMDSRTEKDINRRVSGVEDRVSGVEDRVTMFFFRRGKEHDCYLLRIM